MTESVFVTKLRAQWAHGKFACVGLDSDIKNPKFPQSVFSGGSTTESRCCDAVLKFNSAVIGLTSPFAGMFKPNRKFYDKLGGNGSCVLRQTFEMISHYAPGAVSILDDKVGDIGNTNEGAIDFAFNTCKADAVTVNPYMGACVDPDPKKCDGLANLLSCKDKGILILCRTSNKGSEQIQDRLLLVDQRELEDMNVDFSSGMVRFKWERITSRWLIPVYQYIALLVSRKWNTNGNCGLIIGANHPEELRQIRFLCPDIPVLIPAFGKQTEGQPNVIKETVWAGLDKEGGGIICNNSRHIIFASSGNDYAEAAGEAAKKFSGELDKFVKEKMSTVM